MLGAQALARLPRRRTAPTALDRASVARHGRGLDVQDEVPCRDLPVGSIEHHHDDSTSQDRPDSSIIRSRVVVVFQLRIVMLW